MYRLRDHLRRDQDRDRHSPRCHHLPLPGRDQIQVVQDLLQRFAINCIPVVELRQPNLCFRVYMLCVCLLVGPRQMYADRPRKYACCL
jgi:hypothetical protein